MLVKTKHQDNRGFTLIEILISIVILGLITAPLLSMFVSSAQISTRSIDMGEANMLAETIIESYEAADFTFTDSNEIKLPQTALEGGRFMVKADGEAAYETYTTDMGALTAPYYIGYDNLKAGDSDYQAIVKLDYLGEDNQYQAINDILISQFTPMDFVFAQSRSKNEDMDADAFSSFQDDCADQILVYPGSLSDSNLDQTQRLIDFTVSATTAGSPLVEISYTYNFSYFYPGTEEEEPRYIDEQYTYEYSFDDFGDQVPRAYYLLFYPWYIEDNRNYNDTISIKIADQELLPTNIILVRQNDQQLPSFVGNQTIGRYRAELQFAQPDRSLSQEQIRAMINTNIGDSLIIPGNNPDQSSDDSLVSTKAFLRLGTGGSSVIGSATEIEDDILIKQEAVNRLYQITVEIYAADDVDFSTEPLLTYQATNLQ